jgi:hypothetical protein
MFEREVSAGLCPTKPDSLLLRHDPPPFRQLPTSPLKYFWAKTQDFKTGGFSLNQYPLHIVTATSRNLIHGGSTLPGQAPSTGPYCPIHDPTTSNMTHDSAPVADTSHSPTGTSFTGTSHTSHDMSNSTSHV